jgi:hypothetical protein
MIRKQIIVWSAIAALSACATVKPKPPQPPTPPPAPSSYTLAAVVTDQKGVPVPGATLALDPAAVTFAQTNADGYTAAQVTVGRYTLNAQTDCCGVATSGPFEVNANRTVTLTVTRPDPPKPWETVTDAQLRTFRGAISTTLLDLPCGPRPNAADNILFTAEFGSSCFDQVAREKMIAAYRARSYTHWAIGPIESHGYSGQFPEQDWTANADGFADRLEQLWRAGQIPVVFLMPDTGFCADGQSIDWPCVESRLTPIYSSPRFQALARVVVLAWEANYSNADYTKGVEWMARVFPHARRYLHFESGHAAPCRGDELAESGGPIANEGACWKPVASHIHGFLAQNTWTFGGENIEAGRTAKQQFLYNLWDMGRRLVTCETGWPCVGADGKPLDVVNFEYGSYYVYRFGLRYVPQAMEWGDAGLTAAPFADPSTGRMIDAAKYLTGYGDGGTLDPASHLRTFSLTPSSTTAPRYTFAIHPKG